ncbi:DUF115 domain-containing protein [Shewanella sp. WXL01]|uniref:6-hydroxymethylpterin diphosphokinase MptE-like protein n=1 Tax=Shewanella sp. WXL01 TaxID=2709721 RepID=UPI00143832DB|nr:6-hydroxymethylpterin diphosphokinase MptE-like protein [Shewanella sp. WXL01]NKF50073.1 DUF115 domain-containing protein [Shewanella sp. WXL01]
MNNVERYHNRHEGESAVIVCNGPSLNKMDLSFLKKNVCFGLNKIYLGFSQFHFYPKYYVAVNEKVLRQSENNIKQLASVKFLSNRCPELFSDNALTSVLRTDNPRTRFCKDISEGLEEGWTVTFAALQIAFYLGFSKVFIIGMDHDFQYQGEPNQESTMTGNDPNHFHKDYFADGVKWDNPDLVKSEESYRLAKVIYEEHGRQIVDATLDGKCQVFEKMHYKQAFGADID